MFSEGQISRLQIVLISNFQKLFLLLISDIALNFSYF